MKTTPQPPESVTETAAEEAKTCTIGSECQDTSASAPSDLRKIKSLRTADMTMIKNYSQFFIELS